MTFFGLNPEYRLYIYSQIHEIVFHGKGGYDWNTVYNMPIWLRTFTFNKIKKWYDDEKEAHENNAVNQKPKKEIARPNIPQAQNVQTSQSSPPSKSTYTTKASKK